MTILTVVVVVVVVVVVAVCCYYICCTTTTITTNTNTYTMFSTAITAATTDVGMTISGGLAHRETGRFPGGPLLQEVFRAPSRRSEFISLIIS